VLNGKPTRRWLDSLFELTLLRFVVWVSVAVSTYPGVLEHPFKLANWFDDHALEAYDAAQRIAVVQYHQLPQWNPYWCGGTTSISEPENSFYSPDSIFRLIYGGENGRRLAIMIMVVFGLEGMYRLCRKLDSTAVASAFAAVAFCTYDKFVSFIHDGWVHFMSFELIPWILVALLEGISSVRWRIAGGFFLAWMILAPGTYPTPYGAIAFGYLFVAICLYRLFRREKEPFKGPLLSAFTIGGIGFLLACCKLVPTMLYMREFPRVFTVTEAHGTTELLNGFVPRYYAIVLLAIVGAVFGDLAAGIAIGGALLFFVCSLGDFGSPWAPYNLMKKVPILNALRYPDRFMVLVVFFCAVAGARGLSRLEDSIPKLASSLWHWLGTLDVRRRVRELTKRDFPSLDVESVEPPREIIWLSIGLAALCAYKVVAPLGEELAAPQRGPSHALYIEEAPRHMAEDFKQARGNRRDSHIFPPLNLGSLNCVAGIPIPESDHLRADLPQEEYPIDPALATVKRVSWTPNAIVLDVNAKAPTTILVNQNYARKWRSDVGTVRSELGLLAIDVPAGENQVTLRYRDNVVVFTAFVSLFTVLGILYYLGRQLVPWAKKEYAGFEKLPAVVPDEPDFEGPPEPPTPQRLYFKYRDALDAFDFSRLPFTKAGWLVRIGATVIAGYFLLKGIKTATHPLLGGAPPKEIPSEEIEDYRFQLPERTRHEIFTDLATAELSERARAIAQNTWPGSAWSREDDRGHYERVAVRAAAGKFGISISQVYLVLDEGIRNHWLAPNGEPLPATTPKLTLRTASW
jgi:hypothetical protein